MNKIDQSLSGIDRDINVTSNSFSRRGSGMGRMRLSVGMLVFTLLLAACSSSASKSTPVSTLPAASVLQKTVAPTQTAIPSATPTSVNIPTATNVPQQAVTSALDPCVLINSQEASTLTGASYGNGKEGTTPEGMKMCTYASQTKNVFTVSLIQAPDVSTAQADKATFLADLQNMAPQGLNVTEVPNFADGAVFADASVNAGSITMNGSAFGFLKGTIFFGFSDIDEGGSATPNNAAMQSEATTVLGKLP